MIKGFGRPSNLRAQALLALPALLAMIVWLIAFIAGEVQAWPPSSGLDPRAGVCDAPGGLTVAAGGGALMVTDHRGTTVARASLPWARTARVAVEAAGDGGFLIAVVAGRPATVLDRLRFPGSWRSAPPLVGGRVTIFRFEPTAPAGTLTKLGEGPGPRLNPWWVGFGDFSGSGRPSLLVGVWKTAIFDPDYDRRPFIYGLYPSTEGVAGFQLFAQWLGSRLSNPFVDLAAGDADGDGLDEIVAVTVEPDGSRAVSTYDWSGFGFVLGARVAGFQRVAAASVLGPGTLAVVGRGTSGGDRVFVYSAAAKALSGPDLSRSFLLSGSAHLPTAWNRPGAVNVTTLGDSLTVEVLADGRVSLPTVPGR